MGDAILIKKYPNRRLYDTGARRYVNLEDLEAMVAGDVDFQVVDAETGQDLTRRILAQILLEQMKEVEPIFPSEVLRFAIKQRGATAGWSELVRHFSGLAGMGPLANMGTMVPSWADLFGVFSKPPPPPPAPPPADPEPPEVREELSTLRQRLEELESRLAGKRKK